MNEYYMTAMTPSERGYWKKCTAKTEMGAKREASNYYKQDFRDKILSVAIGDGIDMERCVLFSKKNGQRWMNK